MTALRDRMRTALRSAGTADRDRQRVLYEFGELLDVLEGIAGDENAAGRTRDRASCFVDQLEVMAERHGDDFWQLGYLLNLVGEAVIRVDYLSSPIIDFMRTGLYVYGLRYIERHGRWHSLGMMAAHSEFVIEFTGRTNVKALRTEGKKRIEAGRPFCLVYFYVNELKKRHWRDRKKSSDVHDQPTHTLEETFESPTVVASEAPEPFANPVRFMFDLFAKQLGDEQRQIYLARHLGHMTKGDDAIDPSNSESLVAGLVARLESDGVGRRETWAAIAGRLGMTEKSAKREYLRALLVLLEESSTAVFDDGVRPRFVRKVLGTLRSVIQEKDLRIRDAGRGMGRLVERWEIALRFVLNHRARIEAS